MKYRADIDGLRSIAVIPVILFHLGFNWINGGYYGVDVFFVISGFLITTILMNEITSNSFSMKEFWLRRVRRILPALIGVIATTLLIAPFIIFKGDIITLTSDALSALFSYANIHLWQTSGNYWGLSAENSFFLHAWSLSVEEQFYIFYPLLLFILYKSKQSITKWLVAIIILSLGAYLLGSKYYSTATFYLLPTRTWELASGGLLAVILINRKITTAYSVYKSFFSILGFVLILSSYFVFTGNKGMNFSTISPVLGTVLIIAFSTEDNIIGKLLSSKLLVYIGKISYSLYLWHWPIIVLFRTYYQDQFSHEQILIISVILTVIFSVLSYYLIENKTRKWKHTPKLVLYMVVVIVGFIFLLRSPAINKTSNTNFNQIKFYGLYYDITPNIWELSKVTIAKRVGIFAPKREDKFKESYKNGGIITSSIAGNPQIVVWGDSHGAMWAKTIDEIADKRSLKTSFYTSVGVKPFFNINDIDNVKKTRGFTKSQRISYAKDFIQNLEKWRPKLLIISCRWEDVDDEQIKYMEDIALLSQNLGLKILVLNQPPFINIGDRNSGQYLTFLGYKPGDGNQYIKHKADIKISNDKLEKHFEKYSNITFLDVYSYFINQNNNSNSLVIKDSDVLYYDDDHLSYQGTSLLKNELDTIIIEIISDKKATNK